MSYFGQFKRFDPLLGDVPNYPFPLLPQIAQRARALLKYRTTEQIDSAAKEIDFAIFCYFDELKQNEVARLLRQAEETTEFERFFDWDGGSAANGRWIFKESMEEELDIPTAENTSEVDALRECIEYLDVDREDFPNSQPFELFAVLSLWMLADMIHWCDYENKSDLVKALNTGFQNLYNELERLGFKIDKRFNEPSIAGDYALKAMDAVCYAEHLQIVGWWKSTHKLTLAKEAERQEEERKRRSMRADQLSKARHRKNYEAKKYVIEQWEKRRSEWPSAAKAGIYFADLLVSQGLIETIEPRTVTTWILDHAKQIGVRFR